MANWYDRQSKANLAAHILSQETEIARLTAALAEAEARSAALVAEARVEGMREAAGIARACIYYDSAGSGFDEEKFEEAIRALAQKEAGK